MTCRSRWRFAMIAVVLSVAAGASTASAQARIADVKNFRCTFTQGATVTWRKDGVAEAIVRSASLVLRFEAVDTDAGTAQLRNGAMTSDVTIRLAEGYLHFMQTFRTGPLYTTTVFEAGASGGKFKAVHSRHEFFATPLPDATSSPEQYYGECEAVK